MDFLLPFVSLGSITINPFHRYQSISRANEILSHSRLEVIVCRSWVECLQLCLSRFSLTTCFANMEFKNCRRKRRHFEMRVGWCPRPEGRKGMARGLGDVEQQLFLESRTAKRRQIFFALQTHCRVVAFSDTNFFLDSAMLSSKAVSIECWTFYICSSVSMTALANTNEKAQTKYFYWGGGGGVITVCAYS